MTFSDDGKDDLTIYNADDILLDNCHKVGCDNLNIFFGRIGSGDVWNREREKIALLNNKYKVDCEDMESVALYQLSDRFNIPCLSIKGVSNNEILNESYDDSVLESLLCYMVSYIEELTI